MRNAIRASGETVEPAVFDRLAARFAYVQGDFADPATYKRVAAAIKNAKRPVFYLEMPPSLFGRVVEGLAGAGLSKNARVVVEKPFGHDLASARALAAELHRSVREEQIFRSTISSASSVWKSSFICASRTGCSSRSGIETTSRVCR
jgi:glucose-6-phosphate 1-dehydrogenase